MTRALVFLLAAVALPARAGDYFLLVQSDPSACRDRYASVRAPARDVLADLETLFQGREPRMRVLGAVVMNGRLGFCTDADRRAFEQGLVVIGTRPRIVEERKYRALVQDVATEELVQHIRMHLQRPDLQPAARRRLESLRDEAPKWIAARRHGKRAGASKR